LAHQAKECTVAVLAFGGLLVAVQLSFPNAPQKLLDEFVLLVDLIQSAQAKSSPPLDAGPVVDPKLLADAGIKSEPDPKAGGEGGPYIPAKPSFYPAFEDGYVYYEVSQDGHLTSHGRLGFMDPTELLPDFLKVPSERHLYAYGYVRVRAEAAPSARKIDTLRNGECIALLESPQPSDAISPKTARSGGWLHVKHVACDNNS
jgi:hypothetical protein